MQPRQPVQSQTPATQTFKAFNNTGFKPVTEYVRTNGMSGAVDQFDQRTKMQERVVTLLDKPLETPYKQRIFVDSRNRDITAYPSANHFIVSLPVTQKNVKAITLASLSIPNIGTHKWVCVSIHMPGTDGIIQDRLSGQFPSGSLGVVPLTSGLAYTDYGSGIYNNALRLEIANGISLQEIDITIYAYGGYQQPPMLYPLAVEVLPPPEPAIAQNWFGTFIIDCEYTMNNAR